jgi:hypothetical protein
MPATGAMLASAPDPTAIQIETGAGQGVFHTRLARWEVYSDRPWPGFTRATREPPRFTAADPEPGPRSSMLHGRAWLAGAERAFQNTIGERVQRVEFPGLLGFDVARDGSWIRLRPSTATDQEIEEALLGAALVLATAERDCYCLHGAALARGAQVVVLLAPSGAGKSTLAAALDGRDGWRRLTDDITPLTLDRAAVRAWPRFPQLKLTADAWYPATAAGGERVAAIACLSREAGLDDARWLAPAPTEAVQRLIAGTAGARLFAPDRLGAHLAFCSALAQRVPVRLLQVPDRPGAVDDAVRLAAVALAEHAYG